MSNDHDHDDDGGAAKKPEDAAPQLQMKAVRLAPKPKMGLARAAPVKVAALTVDPAAAGVAVTPVTRESGHDHHGHDHHGHDHHDHEHRERPLGTRPAEEGGLAIQLDLQALLPDERDERGRFERLCKELMTLAGVTRVHMRADAGHLEACVHYDIARDIPAFADQVRALGKKISDRYRAKTWFVRGMDSAQCAMVIEHVLLRTRGILQADVAYAAERLIVEYDHDVISLKQIENKVASVGYALETPEPGHVCAIHDHGGGGLAPKLELPLVIASGVLIGAGLAVEKVPALASAVPPVVATVIFAVALVCGGFFATKGAVLALLAKKVDIETLMVLAAVGAAVLGAWFEGAFLLFLFSLGHMLEHRAMERARQAVAALEKLRPDKARKKTGHDVVEVPLDDVDVDDIIVIRPGDRVPLDAVVVDGASQLDQSALTGESVPVPKAAGDHVFAGTVNKDGSLECKVEKRASESSLARLVDLVAEAEARKSPTQRFTKRVEDIFVPIVLVAAPLLVLGTWGLGLLDVREAVLRGLSLLVAASPCALAVSTPAAVLSAVARAARAGVLIKGAAHLESLAGIEIIALDKTGTLTEGKPKIVDIRPMSGADEARLLTVAASAEQMSAHPIAHAVVDAARSRKLAPIHAEDLRAVHGKGLEATVEGKRVRIGSASMFAGAAAEKPAAKAERITGPHARPVGPLLVSAGDADLDRVVKDLEGAGRTTMIVEHDGVVLGVLGVMDTPRAAAVDAVKKLKQELGIRLTVMLSGDSNAVAKAVAKQVGVDEVRAPLLPAEKVAAVKELMREAPTAMVGDGVNDAPALASATLGVAMGGAGSDVALETADVVLMGDDLHKLGFGIGLARAARTAVRQNIVIALGVASVLIVASVAGLTSVSQAVVLHEGSTLVVVLNGLRLLLHRDRSAS